MWRGGCRANISVAAPFVWRCLTGSAVAPFPHPAHRTGLADCPHPALGQDFTPSPTTGRDQAGLGVRARNARRGARVGKLRPFPLADDSVDVALSFTVMEEGDADRMLSELVRVTRPGGRIAAIVRSLDMPPWTNAAFSPAVRARVDIPGRGDVAPGGCADATLYERFRRAGLVGLTCFSQLASVDASQASRIAVMKQRILASLTEEESAEWKAAVAQAEADGTFFISTPHHCAVGIKPPATVA